MQMRRDPIEIVVADHKPVPAGSKSAFPVRRKDGSLVMKNGRPVINVADSSNTTDAKAWRKAIQSAVAEQYDGPLLTGAVMLALRFELPRPKAHYGTGANDMTLKDSAPLYVGKTPDGLKLRRAVEDALNGKLWADDALVWRGAEEKVWVSRAQPHKTTIIVTPMLYATVGEYRAATQLSLAEAPLTS